MKKRNIAMICAVAMAAGIMTPASVAMAEEKADLEGKRIGVCLVYKGDEWCSAVADEFEKQAKELGADVNIQDGNLDAETQMKQIENFIAQEYDLIAVDPANADGLVPALEKATEAGIPIVFFDNNANYEDIVSYVTWDSYETGQIIGRYLHDRIEAEMDGKANLATLTMATPVNIQTRIEGVKDALKDLDVTYVSEQEYEGNREKASNIITNIKEDIDFVVAGQDNGGFGAMSALQALGNDTTEVYSMGGYGDEAFDTIAADDTNYKGTVVVSPNELVASTYKVISDYFNGSEVEPIVNINLGLCTKENVADYQK